MNIFNDAGVTIKGIGASVLVIVLLLNTATVIANARASLSLCVSSDLTQIKHKAFLDEVYKPIRTDDGTK